MKRFGFAIATLLILASTVQAHFVWLVVEQGEKGQPTAKVYFGEQAEADDAALLDKVAAVRVWSRGADGKASAPLKLSKEEHNDGGGAWIAPVGPDVALSSTLNYGVLDRRGETFLLNYHGKYLNAGQAGHEKLPCDESLPLEVMPYLAGDASHVQVLWHGKPVAGSEVAVVDPAGKDHKLATDEKGIAKLDLSQPGLYSIRAKWVVEEAGEQDGKKYANANHYSTLSLRVPGSPAKPAAE